MAEFPAENPVHEIRCPHCKKTFSASLRLNWTFSPKTSLQIYAQPLYVHDLSIPGKGLRNVGIYARCGLTERGSATWNGREIVFLAG